MQTLSKVVVIGTGLIGGSFALALKKSGRVKQIVGLERSQDALQRAKALGIIDDAAKDWADALNGPDLVLLAAPVAQTESILENIYPHLQPSTIVTDTGSTKSDVVAAARRVLKDKVHQFIPAHPIAGREHNGPEAALVDLYQGKKLVVTALPENPLGSIECVVQCWQACGASPYFLNPEQHDQVFASVSHLPHLLAYALVEQIAVDQQSELKFQHAASGFRDFTRIAGSAPEMWRDISLANRQALQVELAKYQTQLHRLAIALENADGEELMEIFSRAQAARQQWATSIEAAEKLSLEERKRLTEKYAEGA